ncbi:poly(3-hydroxybutyrate) depolymerase [Rhizobium leguminosarum]
MKLGFGRSLLKALRAQKQISKQIEKAVKATRGRTKRTTSRPPKPTLVETTAFGSNPGRLVMKSFVPTTRLPKNPALVVLLHGCHQTPESLDAAAGFSKLAKERGFRSSLSAADESKQFAKLLQLVSTKRRGSRPRRGAFNQADDRAHM